MLIKVNKQLAEKEECAIMIQKNQKQNCQHHSVKVFVSKSNFYRKGYEDLSGVQKAGVPIEIIPDNLMKGWDLRLLTETVESQREQGTYVYLPGDEINRHLVTILESMGYNVGMYFWRPEEFCSNYKTLRVYQNNIVEKKFEEVYSFNNPQYSTSETIKKAS